jgi:hypothetical protein
MTQLERNLSLLQGTSGAQRFLDMDTLPPPLPEYEILQTASGDPTARFRGVFLHSPYNPRTEARRLVETELRASRWGSASSRVSGLDTDRSLHGDLSGKRRHHPGAGSALFIEAMRLGIYPHPLSFAWCAFCLA